MPSLKIDPGLCTGCGDCEVALPGLLSEVIDGRLPISGVRLGEGKDERTRIDAATAACKQKALTLEDGDVE